MHNDSDEILSDILIRWAQFKPGTVGRGFNSRTPGAGDYYRTSRQYDTTNGVLDDDIDAERMKVVDFQIWQMNELHRWALQDHARSLMLGVEVFRNPRLPVDRAARDALVQEARRRLTERLLACGVL